MMFKIVTCPKCNKKQILSFTTCGTKCDCGLFLQTEDVYKQDRKEHAKGMKDFYPDDFDKWRDEMKRYEKQNKIADFKEVSIPDKKLLEIAKENSSNKSKKEK